MAAFKKQQEDAQKQMASLMKGMGMDPNEFGGGVTHYDDPELEALNK